MAIHPQRIMAKHKLKQTALSQLRRYSKFDACGNSAIPANKQRLVPTSGTYPKKFRIGSANVGIKPSSRAQPDLVLVASDVPACGAGAFTKNEFPAASVTVTRDLVRKTGGEGLRGVIANSWCANTLTGTAGLEDALAMSREAGKHVCGQKSPPGSDSSAVMVMHTGTGGQRLPIDNILKGIPALYESTGNSHQHWLDAARGICTTDTFPKLASRTFTLPSSPGTTYSIAGITKGAGMIHPNMATTLGIFCTDAPVTAGALQRLLSTAVDKSYNCISVDGDTSTNDMVTMLANGAAGGPAISFNPSAPSVSAQSADFQSLQRTLADFAADLAKLVVRDGEGSTKLLTVRVRNSPSSAAARIVASAVARSVLVKTAAYGGDPSTWGTVLAALGYALIDTPFAGTGVIVPGSTSISLVPTDGGPAVKCLDRGAPAEGVDEERVKRLMTHEDIEVLIDLRDEGSAEASQPREAADDAVYWTCDLTHDFITINGGFST